jgi:hypothetical protein
MNLTQREIAKLYLGKETDKPVMAFGRFIMIETPDNVRRAIKEDREAFLRKHYPAKAVEAGVIEIKPLF